MLQFERGTSVNLYANFLTLENKEGIVITDPKITIRHSDSTGTLVVDINEQPLILAIETLFFFKWTIPIDQDIGSYTVEYEATIDGEFAEANEIVQVVEFEGDEICDEPYTTKDKVAAFLGVTADKIQDDWLEWTTKYIDTFTCLRFCPITTIEKYDVDRIKESVLMLDHYPILDVIELKNDGVIVNLDDIAIYEEEGFLKLKESFQTRSSKVLEAGFFTRGRQTLVITYKYGFKSTPKDIEWAATVLAASIAIRSLTQAGITTVGDIVEEEIGEYRRKRAVTESASQSFSINIEGSKNINGRLEEDIFSAKNVLRMYRDRKMRSV